ncbi:Nuclease A inhibitor-like protein [Rivularia sp. PCC 7116]|uniref:Nuclease A inhibitor-like protein n=1 Tax=Rivularia sp. PCC 7116 TaxID=373994 RepID=UPI00029F0352|nr:Nuclease A inhibitor-like protein [Rivularia sp. PCC 7116]AFY52782.1 Nuclease A inhibitor-like protein [Rivularia sp. PCC 7116]
MYEIENFLEPTQNLSQILRNNLINIKEYKLFNYDVYLMGQTDSGDWAGVWTQEFL